MFAHEVILTVLNGFIFRPGEGANTKKVSEYDQEIPQSQTADNPMAP